MKGIIFDFNGTMFQDSHLHEAAWVHMVKKYSKGELTEHDISGNLHGRTNKEILNFFVSDSLTDEEIEKLSYEKEAYYRELCLERPEELKLTNGLTDVLDTLKENNIPRTIATATVKENLDFYFDILNAKYQFYYITMLAVLIIAFIIFVFHVIQDFRYEDGKNVKVMFRSFSIKKMPLSHSFASIFLIVCIISTLQSQYLYESFWGNEGRYTGLFLLAIYVITFLFISRFLKLKKRYLNLFLVAGMLACIFGITDYFKLNLFHFKDELVAADWSVYTSTFGNINTYNAYVALVIGCCGALFIDAETKKEKIWYFICYLIASYSLITGGSDNAYLALLALFGFLPFWAFRTWKGVEKYFVMLSSFATITYIAGLIHNHMGNRVEILEGVFSVVIRSRLLVFAVAGLWLLTVILYVIEAAAKERIYIWTVLAAVIILAVGYVLYDANAGGHADKYGSVQRYVHFDDDWGTQRGMVWRLALDDYKNEFTWNEKVFGYGPETFGIMTHQWNNDETIAKTTVIYDNAHNEYLQYFVTIGPIGVLSYVGILICACIEMNRRKEKSPYVLGCFFAVLCYAVQATVNLCVPIVAPIMWMLMSVGTAQSEDEE